MVIHPFVPSERTHCFSILARPLLSPQPRPGLFELGPQMLTECKQAKEENVGDLQSYLGYARRLGHLFPTRLLYMQTLLSLDSLGVQHQTCEASRSVAVPARLATQASAVDEALWNVALGLSALNSMACSRVLNNSPRARPCLADSCSRWMVSSRCV
ncbi:hypothetical protein BJV74DRAFT_135798 [Russula compacta]|nr:hypothetical protein BJV74DRAFT_135798 [Russula compacta]